MPPKNKKRKTPFIADKKYAVDFAKSRSMDKRGTRGAFLTPKDKQDKQYFLGLLEGIGKRIKPTLKDECAHKTSSYNFTPKQVFENTMAFMRITLEYGQPLTLTGLALFNDLEEEMLFGWNKKLSLPPEIGFINEFVKFVKMYNEYSAHKKHNPAGPIFILKNFGWKDKIEISAPSSHSLTDAERETAQRRIAEFSESKNKKNGHPDKESDKQEQK